MGKTYKDSQSNSGRGKNGKQGGKGNSQPVAKKTQRAVRVPGPKPDYTCTQAVAMREVRFCTDISRLLNGLFDKEQYLVQDVEFRKEMYPLYKGAPSDTMFVVAHAIPTHHPLTLAGVQPGTRIPHFFVTRDSFQSKIKDDNMRDAVEKLWAFLRKAGNFQFQTNTEAETEVAEEQPEQLIVREPSTAARVIWEGTRLGLVELRGVTFDVREKVMGDGKIVTISVKCGGNNLKDAELTKVYITIGQLRSSDFVSKLAEESGCAQQNMWEFLRQAMKEEGLPAKQVPAVQKSHYMDHMGWDEFQTRPLHEMVSGRLGFYSLNHNGNVMVKMFKLGSVAQLEVVKVELSHALHDVGIGRGFSIPAKWVVDDISFLQGGYDYGRISAFVEYVRSALVKSGAVKSFKKGLATETVQKEAHQPQSGVSAPQFGRNRPHLATSNGQKVAEGPKPLAVGFLKASYGHWETEPGVVIRCWSHENVFFAKVAEAPEGHELCGYKPYMNLAHLHLTENGSTGKELREYLRSKLREVGELNDSSKETQTLLAC